MSKAFFTDFFSKKIFAASLFEAYTTDSQMVGDVNSQWHTLVRAIKVSDRFEVGTHTFFMI